MKCKKCSENKQETSEFFIILDGKIRKECRSCGNERTSEWRKNNPNYYKNRNVTTKPSVSFSQENRRVIINGRESNYLIFEDGKIYSESTNKYLKPQKVGGNKNGDRYLLCTLHQDNVKYPTYVHRLVGEYFLDLPDNHKELQINHKDLDKKNNHYTNLEWVTHEYNIRHAFGLLGMTDEEIAIHQRELAIKWYHENKEQKRDQNRLWRKNNPEKVAKYRDKWRKNNQDKIKAKREREKEYQRLYQIEYRKNNQDKIKEYRRIYKENKENHTTEGK